MTASHVTRDATLLWLRRDLRLTDNPALAAAASRAGQRGGALLPAFVWEPRERRAWAPGAAGRWWLWHSLAALAGDLSRRGSRLTVVAGDPRDVVPELARAAGAGAVVWATGLEPEERADDAAVAAALAADGVAAVRVAPRALLLDPAGPLTREGRPYTVFTPYWRACLGPLAAPGREGAGAADGFPPPAADGPAPPARGLPAPAPDALPPPPAMHDSAPSGPPGLDLAALEPAAVRPWSAGFAAVWRPGEAGAHARLAAFVDGLVCAYAEDRDRPDLEGTSRLSPHLHWGEVTAAQVWRAVAGALEEAGVDLEVALAPAGRDDQAPGLRRSAGAFLRQLGWREFGHHLLRHFPDTPERPLRERFARFPWRRDEAALEAWRRGFTGYPFVDAAMRELSTTGWMHNRARLVAASFLVKHLLLPWRLGEDWFWDTLVDADLANNALGWQWVAGSGADAAPYFRVFNPVTQGRRYDPDGAYVRRWVPELAGLPTDWVHAPWLASADALADAGVVLGETYPLPIVEHAAARRRALAAYDVVRHAGR